MSFMPSIRAPRRIALLVSAWVSVGASALLVGGAEEDFVDGEVLGAVHGEGDHFRYVLGGDGYLAVELLDALPGRLVGDVGGEFGGDGAGLDEGDADVWQELSAQGFRPPVEAPFGGRIDAVASTRSPAGDRGDVDDVAATGLELVEEDLRGGDRAEEVDLDHLPVVVALITAEGTEQHDAGVVDQHVRAAQLLPHAFGGRNDAVAIGDVGLDGDGAVAEVAGKGSDAVKATREEGDAVAVRRQCTGGRFADAGGCAGDDGDTSLAVAVTHAAQASGIGIPKASRVMSAGSGPPRLPVSSASIAASSPAVSSKLETSKFSAMRCGLVDFGMAERPCCRCQQSMTWAGLLACAWAILRMTASWRVLVCAPPSR